MGTEESLFQQLRVVYRFPFQSPRWKTRYFLGAVFSVLGFVIPVIPWIFLGGYLMRVMRSHIQSSEAELPEWEDWGDLALDGLRYLVVTAVYLLPSILVFIVGMAIYFSSFFAMTAAVNANNTSSALPGLYVLGGMFTLFATMVIAMLLGLLGTIPLPMALAHCAAQKRLGAAFQLRAWWPLMWANKLDYFIAWMNCAGLFMVLYLVILLPSYTLVLTCLTPILAAGLGIYVSLVFAALFGRYYRDNQVKTASLAPLEVA